MQKSIKTDVSSSVSKNNIPFRKKPKIRPHSSRVLLGIVLTRRLLRRNLTSRIRRYRSSSPEWSVMGSRPCRLELRLVAHVDGEDAVQALIFQHRPATARQRGAVRTISTLPREFRRKLAIPPAFPVVEDAPDVAELERATSSVVKLDVGFDLLVEIFILPLAHRDDPPATKER